MTDFTNKAYERGVVGRFIQEPDELDLHEVPPEIFSDRRYRTIYESLYKARAKGDDVSMVSLPSIVPRELVGEAAALTTEAVLNLDYYLRELRDLYARRRLERILKTALANLAEFSADQSMNDLETGLLDVSQETATHYVGVAETVHGAVRRIEERRNAGRELSGVTTGFMRMDAKLDGFQCEEMTVIGARPGTGKTALALQMMMAAIDDQHAVGFFSAEMGRDFIIQRMIAHLTGIEGNALRRGNVTDEQIKQIVQAATRLYDAKFYLNDRANIRIGELISDARLMRKRDGVEIIFIDYLSLITHEDRRLPRHEQMAEVSRRLKQLARELRIPIVVLSQISRDSEGRRPTLSQLRETGALEQDADVVLFLWDETETGDEDAKRVVLTIAKQRNGPVGSQPLMFIKSKMRFYPRDSTKE